jgi:hypothetical protein
VEAIFRGNEMVPDIIDRPPPHHLDLTFRYKYRSTGWRPYSGAMRWSLTLLTALHPITLTLPSGINIDQLVGDIFRGIEMAPDIIDRPPPHHLDLTFRYKY